VNPADIIKNKIPNPMGTLGLNLYTTKIGISIPSKIRLLSSSRGKKLYKRIVAAVKISETLFLCKKAVKRSRMAAVFTVLLIGNC